jgi:hypothetical protein
LFSSENESDTFFNIDIAVELAEDDPHGHAASCHFLITLSACQNFHSVYHASLPIAAAAALTLELDCQFTLHDLGKLAGFV